MRRVLGYAMFGGIVSVVLGLIWLEPGIAEEIRFVMGSEGIAEFLTNMQWLMMFEALPLLIFAVLAMIGGSVLGALIGILIVSILPRLLLAQLEGVIFGITIAITLNAIGLPSLTEGLPFGSVLYLMLVLLIMYSFTDILWNRMPFGLSFTANATRDIAVPIEVLRSRLIPDVAPDQVLADASWLQGDIDLPQGFTPLATTQTGANSYTFQGQPEQKNAATRVVTFHLSEPDNGMTRLEIDMTINSLSPLALWELWARPYTEDYADHLVYRITGAKDRSLYGAMIRRHHKRLARRTAKHLPAQA